MTWAWLESHRWYKIQWTLFIRTLNITAKFVITSFFCSAQSADRVLFYCNSHVILQENIRFVYLLESPRRGDSNKYTKRMIHKKKLFKMIRYSCFRRVNIKCLYNSKLDLTAKSLVTNSVVITRVICTCNSGMNMEQSHQKACIICGQD